MSKLHTTLAAIVCLTWLLPPAAFGQTGQGGPKTAVKQGVEGRIYTPGPFDRIDLSGATHVRLRQGEQDQVFVVGDSQVQDSVTVSAAQGRLEIRCVETWKLWPGKRLEVEVTLRQLRELVLSGAGELSAPDAFKAGPLNIRISGAGSVRFDDLWAERLDFVISGAGDGYLRGGVDLLDLRISGKGKLLAENLHAESATLKISGIGSAEVWVSEKLNLNVSGVGQIDYWGQPTVTRSTSGIAKVNARGDRRAPPAPPVAPVAPVGPIAPAIR